MLLGGPFVHLANQNWAGGGLSLGARLGAPIVIAPFGMALCIDEYQNEDVDYEPNTDCLLSGLVIGAGIGYAAAAVFDWFFLARKDTRVDGPPPTGWSSIRPSLQISDKGFNTGIGFSF